MVPRGKHGDTAGVGAHGSHRRVADGNVERHCNRAGAHDTEQREHGLQAAVHQHRDPLARMDVQGRKAVRHPSGSSCELVPRHRDRAIDEREPSASQRPF